MPNKKPVIDTKFYFVQTSYYDAFLKELYTNVDDNDDRQLESVFFEAINKNKSYDNFPIYPYILGECAGNGLIYKKEALGKKILFNVLSFFHIFKCNIIFRF